MNRYIGVKQINAMPMTREEYNEFRGWQVPKDENPDDAGYLVEYVDGGKANTEQFKGYVSWSPKDVFERAYREVGAGMTFGMALDLMKAGSRVARMGWNGKGMWLSLGHGCKDLPAESFWNQHTKEFAENNGGTAEVLPYIIMKTAAGEVLMGWLASQSDMQDVRTIRFSITPTGGNTTVLDIADFRVHRATPGGVVGIFFDDGRLDTYTISYPEMRARNMVGAIAIEYQAVGNGDRCTQGMLNEMYSSGWDMCVHHTVGFTTLTDSEQITHHRAMRDYLSANNFDRANHIFVYPGGLRNASTDKIARGYWQVSRAVGSMTVQGCAGAFDPVRPPHAYMNSSTTLANAKGRIDRAKAFGGSVVFIFHSIVESNATAENWLRSDFVELLDYIASQGLPVVPISDIWTKQPRFTAF